MTPRILTTTAAAALLALGLAACGSDTKGSDDSAAPAYDLVSDGTLTVCSDVPYPPFEDIDASAPSGYSGFDIDVVQHVADNLELKLVVTKQGFDGLESGLALNAGTCDLVASAMTITADRAKALLFTDGYYDSEQSLLVAKDSGITAIGDLDGKKVAVQKGTTGEEYARKNVKGAKILSFPGDPEEFAALKADQVDAILQDLPVNLEHAKGGDFSVVETYKTAEKYGFAAKKGNDKLVDAINAELAAMHEDGSYDEIYASYFSTK